MSMLSAQCDELRERAKTLRQGRWSDGADDARLMEDAADTIEGLESENAKLRELCVDMYRCSDPCNDCPHYNGSSSDFYCRLGIGWKARRMRELEVEVDA